MTSPPPDKNEYPRVLIIAIDSMRPSGNTGHTLVNLFRDWPPDRLAQIHSVPNSPDPRFCSTAWRLSPANVPLDVLSRRLMRAFGLAALVAPQASVFSPTSVPRLSWKGRLRNTGAAWFDCFPVGYSTGFRRWLHAFRPDLVYAHLGSIRQMNIALRIARRFKIPIVPHFMDDWPGTIYCNTLTARLSRFIVNQRLRTVLRHAPFGLAISEAMADEYGRRYAKPFMTFMNCTRVAPQPPVPPVLPSGAPQVIVHVGGVHLGRLDSVLEVGRALTELAAEGLRAELHMYNLHPDNEATRHALQSVSSIRLMGELGDDRIGSVFGDAALLLHTEPFDTAAAAYLRLSLSTKLPLYLASGRAILVYGNPQINTPRYLLAHGACLCVPERDAAELKIAIRRLLLEPTLCQDLGQRAWSLAVRNHDSGHERARFAAALREAAGRPVNQGDR